MKNMPILLTLLLLGTGGLFAQANNAIPWSGFSSGFGEGREGNNVLFSALLPLAGRGTEGNVLIETGFLANRPLPGAVSSVASGETVPVEYRLDQNYPNPFNPTTTVSFALPQRNHVTLNVFDVLGRHLLTILNQEMNAGTHKVVFDAARLPTGLYFYRIQAGDFVQTKRLLLIK